MGKEHSHALPRATSEKSLWLAFGLTSTFLVAEVIGGLVTGSLALISDAAHMFTDAAALAIALAAVRVARRPTDLKRSFGYHRFEILAAAFNALLLFGVAIYILFEAWQRLRQPPAVETTGMLVIASLGMVINLVSIRLLAAGKESSLNIKGAYLEVWSDLLGSVGVIAGAVIIKVTDWLWVDSVIAVGIGLWVLPRTWVLLKESMNILLEGVPDGIDVEAVVRAIKAVPGVQDVHEMHIWALSSNKTSLSVHVVTSAETSAIRQIEVIRSMLADRFDIRHSTIQCELTPCGEATDAAHWIEPRTSLSKRASSASTN